MTHRRMLWIPLFILFMGLIAFYNVTTSSTFSSIRGIDVIRILAAGMCFGAAIASSAMLLSFRDRR